MSTALPSLDPPLVEERIAHRDVTGLIDPDCVVVIGANERRRSVVAEAIAGGGRAYLVHPSGESILGEDVYTSVRDLPEVPDCALILVGHHAIVDVMREALEIGRASCRERV